jgi:hypothetical protein
MKCDEFLVAMETGGFLARLRARHHAAGCPRCAAEYAAFSAAMREWAVAEPLSAEARTLWLQAAVELETRPVRQRARKLATAVAIAAATLIAIGTVWMFRHNSGSPAVSPQQGVARRDSRHLSPITVERIRADGGQAILSSEVEQLDAELKVLRRKVEKRQIENQIAAALVRFGEP